MLVVLPFCRADADRALDLLQWIGQLGGGAQHDCLLVVDAGVDWSDAVELLTEANRSFRTASVIATEGTIEGWPAGPNALWLKAAAYAKEHNVPWLWLEPDALPLATDWLTKIQAAYTTGFMGHVYECNNPGLPERVLSGVAVYPADAIDVVEPEMAKNPLQAWDVAASPAMLPRTQPTRLIHHFWGKKGLAPTFLPKDTPAPPENTFNLDKIHPEAVIFHRNNDGTLLHMLRARAGLAQPGKLVVVLPFCNHDALLMVKSLEWMTDIGMEKTHDCLLSYDITTLKDSVRRITARAANVFNTVATTSYKMPKGTQFPQTAAWQHAARFMAHVGRNWLWLEADNVVLKKDWLARLEAEYKRGKKSFAGPFMQGRGHINGGAIYPANTPSRCPRTMSHTNNAFDVEMATEMMSDCHDIGNLWQCAWGVVHGRLDQISGDELPSFPRGSILLKQIKPGAVLFHRDKSGSLIDRFREGHIR